MKNTVLIIEDEFPIALDLKRRMEKLDFNVIGIATNGEKAKAYFSESAIDLVLLDINLNENKSGIELGVELRTLAQVAIVFITSYSNNLIFEKAVEQVEPDGYLVKPIRDNELYRTVKLIFATDKKTQVLPHYVNQLGNRELEILKFVKKGCTDEEISQKLFLSISTVRTHLRRAYAKLLVRNRVEVVNFINKYDL